MLFFRSIMTKLFPNVMKMRLEITTAWKKPCFNHYIPEQLLPRSFWLHLLEGLQIFFYHFLQGEYWSKG